MKNSLEDLNNHLFAQIERLGEEDLKEEKLQLELNRTKAITSVATQIIQNGKLALEVQKALGEGRVKMFKMAGIEMKFVHTPAMCAWMKVNYMLPAGNLAIAFNNRFGTARTPKELHAFRKRLGLKTGRTGQFQKGMYRPTLVLKE